jgi:hypothetical protein
MLVRPDRSTERDRLVDQPDPWDWTELMLAEISEVVAKNRKIVAELRRREENR